MKTIAVDFDGVIHAYSKDWEGGVIYDTPVPGARLALKRLAEDYRVVVFTARNELEPVREWLVEHAMAGLVAEVTNVKPKAWLYIDDRGLRFEPDVGWSETLLQVARLAPEDDWGEKALEAPPG